MIEVTKVPSRAEPLAGYATMTSTFSNSALYFPHKGDSENLWKGEGIRYGRVSLWCGG